MNTQLSDNKVIMTRRFLSKFIHGLDAIGRTMKEDDLVEVSFMSNTILIEGESMSTIIKLETQK